MTSYDGTGISRYMMVHGRHMSLYDEDSALILVMATDVPGIRPLISGTCLLILRNFVPLCFRDWYMLAHPALLCSRLHPAGQPECGTFIAPKRHARSRTRQSFSLIRWHAGAPRRLLASAGACGRPRRRAANLRFKVVLYRPYS